MKPRVFIQSTQFIKHILSAITGTDSVLDAPIIAWVLAVVSSMGLPKIIVQLRYGYLKKSIKPKKIKMKKRNIQLMLVIILSSAIWQGHSQNCNFAKVVSTKPFTITELESKWTSYTKDAGFKILADAVVKQGFERIAKNEKAAWGFGAGYISDSVLGTSEQKAEVCSFDFYKKTTSGIQMCSMVWRKVGGTIYKAYIIFPIGEKDFTQAIEKSTEFYVDEKNEIQKAHSFGRCWSRCVFKRFSATNCGSAMAACGAAAGGLAIAGIGVTTPIALGIFGGCAGIFCLAPLAICAAYCL